MNNSRKDFSNISAYYEELIRKYGHDSRACDYGRAESQAIKFAVLSDVLDLTGKSLLDVGCGFADYCHYLRDRFGNVRYAGLDITEGMINEAKKINSELDLQCGNILEWDSAESFDVVTANGIFYLISDNPKEKMQEIILSMYARANMAVAFNSLSIWAPEKEEGEFYADPLVTMAFCKTITPWVTLRHDYHSRDFTIYMYRDRNV